MVSLDNKIPMLNSTSKQNGRKETRYQEKDELLTSLSQITPTKGIQNQMLRNHQSKGKISPQFLGANSKAKRNSHHSSIWIRKAFAQTKSFGQKFLNRKDCPGNRPNILKHENSLSKIRIENLIRTSLEWILDKNATVLYL